MNVLYYVIASWIKMRRLARIFTVTVTAAVVLRVAEAGVTSWRIEATSTDARIAIASAATLVNVHFA